MKQFFKKSLAVLLAILLVIPAMSFGTFAEGASGSAVASAEEVDLLETFTVSFRLSENTKTVKNAFLALFYDNGAFDVVSGSSDYFEISSASIAVNSDAVLISGQGGEKNVGSGAVIAVTFRTTSSAMPGTDYEFAFGSYRNMTLAVSCDEDGDILRGAEPEDPTGLIGSGKAVYSAVSVRVMDKSAPRSTVTYKDGAGGTVFADMVYSSCIYGSKTPVFSSAEIQRDGYEFLGWTPEVSETVTSDAVYTATWEQKEVPSGGVESGAVESGAVESGAVESGAVESGAVESGAVESGAVESGAVESGAVESGAVESGAVESGAVESGAVESGAIESGAIESGAIESGAIESGAIESGAIESGAIESGAIESGAIESGAIESGAIESGAIESGAIESGAIESGAIESGAIESGAIESGAIESGAFRVTYTDGVENEIIFEDRTYICSAGVATPAFSSGIPQRDGYIFLGWDPEISETVTSDAVYSAVWKQDEQRYYVRYSDGAGNTVFAEQITICSAGVATPAFSSGIPQREGYEFLGWSPAVSPKVTANAEYTATWKKIEEVPSGAVESGAVCVTFYIDGETSTAIVSAGILEKPAVPAKSGYGFAGWYADAEYTEKCDFTQEITDSAALYARFFLWGDVNGDGDVTALDADLVLDYIMEVDNPAIVNIMAGMVNEITDCVSARDGDTILDYIMEVVDVFPIESCEGYEFDIENVTFIAPQA